MTLGATLATRRSHLTYKDDFVGYAHHSDVEDVARTETGEV